MVMTINSFTGDPTLDKVVLACYIIRMIICLIYSILNFVQLGYELKTLYNSKKPPTTRFFVFLCLSIQPLMRILACGFFIRDHDYTPKGLFFIFGNWCISFIFSGWLFLGCVWIQILYTFYLSEEICWKNSKRIWNICVSIFGIHLAWTALLNILCVKSTVGISSLFTTIGFVVTILTVGLFVAINLMILSRQMKSSKTLMLQNQANVKRSKKIKRLGITLAGTIVVLFAREVWLVATKPTYDSNIRHASSFLTLLIEFFQMTLVMLGVANIPINYLLFKRVNQKGKSSTPSSTNNSQINSSTCKLQELSSSSKSIELNDFQSENVSGITLQSD